MRCDKCEKEAVLHYQSKINGEKREYHLCADCAKAEGFGEMLTFRPRSMFGEFFGEPFGELMQNFFREPFGGLIEDFYSEPFGMLNRGFFGSGLMAPSLTRPNIRIKIDETEEPTETESKKSHNIPKDAGSEIKAKRELHALRHQLKTAIAAEEFEKCAELRDKIHQLEK